MRWLAFADRRQERQWEHTQAADQAGLDAAVSIQTLLFPSLVARTVRMLARSGFSSWFELDGPSQRRLYPSWCCDTTSMRPAKPLLHPGAHAQRCRPLALPPSSPRAALGPADQQPWRRAAAGDPVARHLPGLGAAAPAPSAALPRHLPAIPHTHSAALTAATTADK